MRAIKLLRAHGVDVKINGSVVKENVHDMEAIYALGRSLDMPVHMDTYMPLGLHDRSAGRSRSSPACFRRMPHGRSFRR